MSLGRKVGGWGVLMTPFRILIVYHATRPMLMRLNLFLATSLGACGSRFVHRGYVVQTGPTAFIEFNLLNLKLAEISNALEMIIAYHLLLPTHCLFLLLRK